MKKTKERKKKPELTTEKILHIQVFTVLQVFLLLLFIWFLTLLLMIAFQR